jgi:hypothetical protein
MSNWTTKLQFTKERPEGRTPSEFKEALKGTLNGGALTVNLNEIPIKLKSLRTSVATVAKEMKAHSHVILNKETNIVSMWLEKMATGKGRGITGMKRAANA